MERGEEHSNVCTHGGKAFVEFLGRRGVRGQYTGDDAPDDNAYVERVIRTIKEEEVWPNQWDTWREAHAAIEAYVDYYNTERIHSALAAPTFGCWSRRS